MADIAIIRDSLQHIRTLVYTHSAAVASGQVLVVNGQLLIAVGAYDANAQGVYFYRGKFEFDKKGSLVVTAGDKLYWDAENTYADKVTGMAAAAAVAGSNTGNGTVGSITVGSKAKAGTYTLTCTSKAPGVATTGTGAAAAHNTGNGTITASPATGVSAKAGVYLIECVKAASNSGTFIVRDPDGIYLGIATVGSEFSAGSHVTFTIADGSGDFIVGDVFTVTVANSNSGTFSVKDPDNVFLANATVAVAYTSTQINLTIADGSTDFAVGDSFTIAVTQGNVAIGLAIEDSASAVTTVLATLRENI
jgi:predicted RecA/RadA family phage recombinase